MSDIQTWSNTAASNNASPPNGFPEGMAPSTVNDAAREVMAAISRYRSDTDGVNTSAGTNTITLAASRTMTAYAQGDLYTFKAGGTNTGATTINVDSLGAKDVQFNGAALTGGEIVSGLMYTVVYDGTQFQLLNASAIPAIDITTLEVTNINAKDGTTSLVLANTTGLLTSYTGIKTVLSGSANATYAFYDNSFPTTQPVHYSFWSTPAVVAVTLPSQIGFGAKGTSTSVGGAVTTQYGFIAESTLTSATTNYGFYSDIAASGTSRYNFYSNGTAPNYFGGNTIVSVTDNTNAALRVTQTGTGNSLEIEDSTNPDSTPFIIDNAGGVISGHSTAIATVVGTTAVTPKVQTIGTTNNLSSIGLYQYSTNAGSAPYLFFSKSKNATVGSFTSSTSGDLLGSLVFNGVDSNNADFRTATSISSVCDSVAATSVAGYIRFQTTNTGGTLAERMRLTADGTLDLRQSNTGLTSDAPLNVLRFTDTDTTTAANQPIGKIEFYNSDTGNAAVGAYILASAVGTSGGGTLRFAAAADAGAVAEVARVASTGFTVTADTAGLGYGTGTGGAVTQATSRTTGVTLNKTNGAITLVSAAGTATWQSFTVTNSTVAATDVVIVNQKSGTDLYMIHVTAVAAGSFRISFATTGGTTTEQPVFNFAVIKAVAA